MNYRGEILYTVLSPCSLSLSLPFPSLLLPSHHFSSPPSLPPLPHSLKHQPLSHNDSVDVSSRRACTQLTPSAASTSDHSNCIHDNGSPSQNLKSGDGAKGREEFQQRCTEFVREGEEEEPSVRDRSRGGGTRLTFS